MKSLGFTITTAERLLLSRYEIKQEPDGLSVDADFKSDFQDCLYNKKLKYATETLDTFKAIHPGVGFWLIQVLKSKSGFFVKPMSEERPPWLHIPHGRISGLFMAHDGQKEF